MLYRKWKAIKDNDLDGLIDKRGKWRKGKSSIDETLWQAFLSFYLDENQHPIMRCYEYTKMWAREDFPHLVADMPSYTTFYRRIQADIPEAVEVLGRQGEKAFRDRCAPYIKRTYDDMASNEWWIADNHTFDIITMGANGKCHRLYLTAFFDARSGIFTGCHVTTAPSSQSTLVALRKGILKYGIPENIYVDNGREFLTHDIGGLGHRKKKPKNGQEPFTPPPVFERLGIKMTNAISVNGAAVAIIGLQALAYKSQISETDLDEALKASIAAKATDADLQALTVRVGDIESAGYQTAEQVQAAIAAASHLKYEIVDAAPAAEDADANTWYMVMNEETGHYDIYGLLNGEVRLIDDTTIDLTGYSTTEAMQAWVTQQITALNVEQYATDEELQAVIIDVGAIQTALANVYTREEADAKFTDEAEAQAIAETAASEAVAGAQASDEEVSSMLDEVFSSAT